MQVTNATHGTDASTETIHQQLAKPGEPNLRGFLQNVSQIDGVRATAKPEAHTCISHGCQLTENLAQVHIDGYGTRVLCPIHVLDLVDREVGLK